MNFRKFLLIIVLIMIFYLLFIKDFLYYRFGKEYCGGKIISIEIIRFGMGTESKIHYAFYVDKKNIQVLLMLIMPVSQSQIYKLAIL